MTERNSLESERAELPDHGGADAGVRIERSKLNEWADDFEAAAHDVTKGIKSTVLITRAQEVRSALSKPAPVAANASAEPALNWQLSDDTKARIAEIDDNRRNAALNASDIVAGSSNASAEARLREALEPGPCPKCGCDSYVASEPSWKHDNKWGAVACVTCDKCDHQWDIDLSLSAHPHASDCDKQGER